MAAADLTSPTTGAAQPRRSLESTHPHYGEKLIQAFLFLAAMFSIAVTTGIVISLLPPTIDFFREIPISALWSSTQWAPALNNPSYGIIVILAGTAIVVVIGLAVAIPLGLMSAIYLSEYASSRVRRTIKPALEVLEGIPTVAIGLFAAAFLRPLAETVLPFLNWRGPFSIGVAAFAVGLLIVPLVASVADDAMKAVPQALRDGAYALGASKLQVTLKVVLPAAISGIVAAFVLAGSRAVGETMVVFIAAGGGVSTLSLDPAQGAQTMTAYIASVSTGDISTGTITFNTVFVVGTVLFTITLFLNSIAIRFVRKYREVYD